MSKPRLLIPLVRHFVVRYLVRTGLLQQISEYAEPIVLIGWDDEILQREMEELGATVLRLPEVEQSRSFRYLIRQIDFLHNDVKNTTVLKYYNRPMNMTASYWTRFKQTMRSTYLKSLLMLPGYQAQLYEREEQMLSDETNIDVFIKLIADCKPDALYSITPYLRQEYLLIQAAKRAKLPMAASLLSFDNILSQGRFPAIFNSYFLWNQFNVKELYRAYPEAKDSDVVVAGAPQFDFYWRPEYIWSEEVWRAKLNIPPGRPVLLIGANSARYVPREEDWVKQLDDAIEAGYFPNKPIILLRRHPYDESPRWANVVKTTKHVIYDEPWALGSQKADAINVTVEDIQKLASSLAHSSVHINTASTMAIDGAIFDKPLVGPAYDDRPDKRYDKTTRNLYFAEHYLGITHSGGLTRVFSREELLREVKEGLLNPSKHREGRKKIVLDLISYDDGQSTQRVSEALHAFLIKAQNKMPNQA